MTKTTYLPARSIPLDDTPLSSNRADVPWNEIDEGIKGPLRILVEEMGIETISSCQGGGYGRGHGYMRPTITFNGHDDMGREAEDRLTRAGYIVFQILRRYIGGKPVYWQVEFVDGAAHGK